MSAQQDPGGRQQVVIHVPSTFDLDASTLVEREVSKAPDDVEIAVDFGEVLVCHPFVLARLLTRVAALRRAGRTILVNLNDNQQRLLSTHGLSKIILGSTG